ncbi:carboxylesterase family protein [Galbibacter sp. EGI 63066]|uniref:carboxylesterase/lipase family protein n=1 Tax=Galbibacter sp. EGI 63066 TaxID=2993559 RepID=UPI0022496524|nr:carboxylesterase family protein [Galbibacter sp. EGI 63066]MCX2681125.1 carboxylesterase family protein [Galbibacter sp. EGI 63066]
MKIRILFLFVVFLSGFMANAQTEVITGEDVAVTDTESGKVRGFIQNGIYTYKGIPYARAERFMPATKVEPWEGVRSSTMYGPVAPLMIPTTQVQDESEFVFDHDWGYTSEDCLRLNVWTPSIDDSKKRPVLFWIHGGGYTAGSSQELPSYHGENLSAKGDVVVVSINHRLNILGFLDLSAYGEKYKESANNSMLDIVTALDWVKTNISNFGGDPNNITIFGQSGGGAKVNTLMAMPRAKGLFHKAINQSGSFRGNLSKKETTQAIAAEVLNQLSLSKNQVDSLQSIPFDKLSAAGSAALNVVAEKMKEEGIVPVGFGLNWGPSMDGSVLPYDLMSSEAFELSKDIPLMLGTTKNEFTPFMNGRFFKASEEEVIAHIKETYKDKADDYIAAVKKAYPNDTRPSDLLNIDTAFRPGAVFQANQKSQLENGAAVYMFMFTWQSPVFDGKYKALHCMELPFVFDNVERARQMTGGGEEANVLADKMSRAWINFAKTGNPNHDGLPQWPQYNPENTATMFFDNTCEVKPQHDKEFLALMADM